MWIGYVDISCPIDPSILCTNQKHKEEEYHGGIGQFNFDTLELTQLCTAALAPLGKVLLNLNESCGFELLNFDWNLTSLIAEKKRGKVVMN